MVGGAGAGSYAVLGQTDTDPELKPRNTQAWDAAVTAEVAHELVNQIRDDHGRVRLEWSPDIVRVAERYAEQMAEEQYLDHTSPSGETPEDRFQEAGLTCYSGENIYQTWWMRRLNKSRESALTYLDSPAGLAESVVRGWMHSEGHRENMLSRRHDAEGIAFVRRGENGAVYAVQNFCDVDKRAV